jgi:hypothetical protein
MFNYSFSAYVPSSLGSKQFDLVIDSVTVASTTFFFNSVNVHTTIPCLFNVESLSAGSHTIQLRIPAGVTVDTGDYAHLTVLETMSNGLPGTSGTSGTSGSSGTSGISPTTGSWTLTPGANTVSFTVTAGQSYVMWVNGNIPNGIINWNATVTLSNTNVPVIGVQYGWYYLAGNALVLTSIPSQIIGTAGSIITAAPAVSNANIFTFGITNNSVSPQIVYYGYVKVS